MVWAWLGATWPTGCRARASSRSAGLVYALVYLGLGAATAPWHVWALFVLYGVFYGLTEPVEKALLKDLVAPISAGRAYGAYNFVVGDHGAPRGLAHRGLWRAWGPASALEVGAAFASVACVALLAWDAWRTRELRRAARAQARRRQAESEEAAKAQPS